jgi:hypothetical protein
VPEGIREQALDWIESTGGTQTAAAKHFGVTARTVRRWVSWQKSRAGNPPTPGSDKKKKRAHARKGKAPKRASKGTAKKRAPRPSTDPGEPPAGPGGKKRKRAKAVDPDLLDAAMRRALRQAILKRVNYLATDDSIKTRGQQAAAITLGIMLDKYGIVLRTMKQDDEGAQREGATDRLREALQLDQPTARADVEEDPSR